MADSTAFLDFLKSDPLKLANFIKIFQAFLANQNKAPAVTSSPSLDQPRVWKEGEKHALTSTIISDAEIDALEKNAADAEVLDKAIACAQAFIAGLMMGL